MMGTPAYMAPEQVLAQGSRQPRRPLFVRRVFYRLLTGKLPFEADTAIGMVQKQLSETPTPAHEHRTDLPEWCQTVLDRALAKSPAERYQTGEEFRAALLAAISQAATEHTSVLAAAHVSGLTPPLGAAVNTVGDAASIGVRVAGAAAAWCARRHAGRRVSGRRDHRLAEKPFRHGRRTAGGGRSRRRRARLRRDPKDRGSNRRRR